jgi:hypothetical protein
MRTLIVSLMLAGSLLAQSRSQLSNGNFNRLRRQGAVAVWNLTTASGTTAPDLSGHGNTLTKAAGTQAPTSTAHGWTFDGTQYGTAPVSVNQPITLLSVHNPANTATPIFAIDGIDVTHRSALFLQINTSTANAYAGTSLTGLASSKGAYETLTGVFDGASSKIYRNGIVNASGDVGSQGVLGLTVGAEFSTLAVQNWIGTISLQGVYAAALTPAIIAHNTRAIKWLLAPAGVTLP